LGGYHLVWPRDMVNSATGLLASGHTETPLRALMYLATAQRADGGFAQNFWINGEPYWTGIQLDEVAFPIMLAHRLEQADALRDFDPYPMVMRAAGYLVREGPSTQQERWEENSGYSPSTLAANIAALTCAALFAASRGAEATSTFLQDYADFLNDRLERWTVTTDGTLLAGVPRHYVRICPVAPDDVMPDEDPNRGEIEIRNRAPGEPARFPAKDVVDGGFLELVRYGVRDAHDPIIVDTLRVIDAVLKVDTPFGPCWRRYNHDGYGQRPDGTAFDGWGRGRAWPLLTGERGHYELAAGRAPQPYLHAMENFATSTRLLPEQVWDEADLPSAHMYLGRPTGAAMPLAWAHAEYVKLLRSAADGQVFDRIPAVAERYASGSRPSSLRMWKFNRQPKSAPAGTTLRVLAGAPFRLHFVGDDQALEDRDSSATSIGMHFTDVPLTRTRRNPVRFTFYWPDSQRWEGREFQVDVKPDARERP
jgi:glucoamylase